MYFAGTYGLCVTWDSNGTASTRPITDMGGAHRPAFRLHSLFQGKIMKKLISTTVSCIVAGLALTAFDVSAASIRVECEQRGVQRSTISVDGKNLPALAAGQYSAQAVSGPNTARTGGLPLVLGEVEADFDSDRGDIAEGATAISGNFIVNGSVTGKILLPDGTTLIADTVACRVRNR